MTKTQGIPSARTLQPEPSQKLSKHDEDQKLGTCGLDGEGCVHFAADGPGEGVGVRQALILAVRLHGVETVPQTGACADASMMEGCIAACNQLIGAGIMSERLVSAEGRGSDRQGLFQHDNA